MPPETACEIAPEWSFSPWVHELQMSEVVLTAIMQRVNGSAQLPPGSKTQKEEGGKVTGLKCHGLCGDCFQRQQQLAKQGSECLPSQCLRC